MTTETARYRYSVWHGESGSLWYIIDTQKDEIVETFHSLASAQEYTEHQNALQEVQS